MDDLRPEKSLTDRAYDLFTLFLGVGIRPGETGGMAANMEELGREAVRVCRALEAEVAVATPRPEPEKKPRQSVQRGVPPQPEELNLDQEAGFYDE